jgi:hypothetical protein
MRASVRARSPAEQERERKQKAYRERVRDGVRIAHLRYDGGRINFLVASEWLDPALADDPETVADAVGDAVDRLLAD